LMCAQPLSMQHSCRLYELRDALHQAGLVQSRCRPEEVLHLEHNPVDVRLRSMPRHPSSKPPLAPPRQTAIPLPPLRARGRSRRGAHSFQDVCHPLRLTDRRIGKPRLIRASFACLRRARAARASAGSRRSSFHACSPARYPSGGFGTALPEIRARAPRYLGSLFFLGHMDANRRGVVRFAACRFAPSCALYMPPTGGN
jgi:hypothetical protein